MEYFNSLPTYFSLEEIPSLSIKKIHHAEVSNLAVNDDITYDLGAPICPEYDVSILERQVGVEPTLTGWKPIVLP